MGHGMRASTIVGAAALAFDFLSSSNETLEVWLDDSAVTSDLSLTPPDNPAESPPPVIGARKPAC